MQVQLPVSYLEWGICLITFCFCWWKYGWNMEVMKGVRQVVKKFEILISPEQSALPQPVESWEVKHFKRIPTTGSPFNPRTKGRGGNRPNKHSFATLLSRLSVDQDAARRPQAPCFMCNHPAKIAVLEEIKKSTPLKNCLGCGDNKAPHNPWYVRRFSHFFFFWRKWYLGEQYHVLSLKQMMADEKLNWALEQTAKEEFQEGKGESMGSLLRKHYRKAEALLRRMRPKQPKHPWYALYVRIAGWIIGKFLAQIYPKIFVRQSQIDLLHKARNSGYPILYLPVHRSHIDYVLISWTLVANDIRSPLVAAGENLNIPVFSLMMKSVGGFFIKRRLEPKAGQKDLVYRTMLESYMRMSLECDNDMEFFIEGGRTRTGKPCLPKGGLLNIVVETLLTNKIQDILVVPINFSYDRLLEGNYIREQLGQPKVNESFASAAMALWNSLQPKYGNARVDFGHPFSMKEFVLRYCSMHTPTSIERLSHSDFENSENSESSEDNMEQSESNFAKLGHNGQRNVVEALGRHGLYEGVKCFTMTSTNAIAFLLLNKYRTGTDIDTLKEEIRSLKAELLVRGHDSGFSGDMEEVVNYGVKILGPTLIRVEFRDNKKFLEPVSDLPNVIELSYYSNCVLPIYAMESIIATSVLSLIGYGSNSDRHVGLNETELVSRCLEYIEVLHYEFILSPPCQSVQHSVQQTVEFMAQQGILKITEDPSRVIEVTKSVAVFDKLVFLKNLLCPIFDAYIASSKVLRRLVDHEAEEKRLQMDMLAEIKGQLQRKVLTFGESMALDPIRNFMQLAVRWQIMESYKKDLKTIYYLHDDFNNIEAVEEIVQRLVKLRV